MCPHSSQLSTSSFPPQSRTCSNLSSWPLARDSYQRARPNWSDLRAAAAFRLASLARRRRNVWVFRSTCLSSDVLLLAMKRRRSGQLFLRYELKIVSTWPPPSAAATSSPASRPPSAPPWGERHSTPRLPAGCAASSLVDAGAPRAALPVCRSGVVSGVTLLPLCALQGRPRCAGLLMPLRVRLVMSVASLPLTARASGSGGSSRRGIALSSGLVCG